MDSVLRAGVASALAYKPRLAVHSAGISATLAKSALLEADGPPVYDLAKAALAAARVLGMVTPLLARSLSQISVLAALGALAGLQGFAEPPSMSCACVLLSVLQRKKISRAELFEEFTAEYEGGRGSCAAVFEQALGYLERLDSLRLDKGDVTLIERVPCRSVGCVKI